MLSGTGYPSGENYPAGTGMELFFYPHVGTGNPTDKILRVRVRVGTTRRVRTCCHLYVGHMPIPLYTIHFQPSSNGTVLVGRVTVPRPFRSEWCVRRVL
jgi:hypothetical protein